jgi:cellulose biosynthesis protein BcsQ
MLNLLNQVEQIKQLLSFRQDEGLLSSYKIFVRLSVLIEVYIVTDNQNELKKELSDLFDKYRIRFYFYTEMQMEDSIAAKNIFEGTEIVNYGLKYRFHSLLEDKISIDLRAKTDKLKKENDLPPVATFYSYKGGMGRTTTMTTYALHLAQMRGRKVVVMDFDLEAPGYLNFFNLSDNKLLTEGNINGIVEYLLDCQFSKNIDEILIDKYHIDLEEHYTGREGKVFIFPAGNLLGDANKQHYLEGLARLDMASEERLIDSFLKLFIKIKQVLKPDIILIDSRTGFNDIYGTMALIMSDVIIGFFGSSEQTKPGLEFLLDKTKSLNSSIDILLVNSILPQSEEEMQNSHKLFSNYVAFELQENVAVLPLSRNKELEKIGLIKAQEEAQGIKTFEEDIVVQLVKEKKIPELETIFSTISAFKTIADIFPKQTDKEIDNSELRRRILQILVTELPKNFAEEERIDANKFFYRKSMQDLFDKDKFIIQGFKGTGKTYLYKALKDSNLQEIQNELKRRANKSDENFEFIDVISEKGKDNRKLYDFGSLPIFDIKDKHYYFKYFWVVYTWNSIMLDIEAKVGYKTTVSESLKAKIQDITPDITTSQRFDSIIKNLNELVEIEKDLATLDKFLDQKNINLVVLYDQLDNLIKPEYWGVIASPLVEYWWNNFSVSKRLFAKIFIRTDLFNRTTGTNMERLKNNNLISIEWDKEEVYAYFFKIIFSKPKSKKYFFDLLMKNGKEKEFAELKQYLDIPENQNQVQEIETVLRPLMTVFFGETVQGGRDAQGLGHPYEWFYQNLTNADQKSISLRPFINLIKGAIDYAIKKPDGKLPIIHSAYYANMQNRDDVVKRHFEDLIREDFNKDLEKIFDYFRQQGDEYKYIFLTKQELQKFLNSVIQYYGNSLESKNDIELIQLLEANGIIQRNPKSFGDVYYFPQLYKYWLGLKNRRDKDVRDTQHKTLTNISKLLIGNTVECEITRISEKTLYVKVINNDKISENSNASIHIYQLPQKVESMYDFGYQGKKVVVGQKVKAKIIGIDDQYGIRLSLKSV